MNVGSQRSAWRRELAVAPVAVDAGFDARDTMIIFNVRGKCGAAEVIRAPLSSSESLARLSCVQSSSIQAMQIPFRKNSSCGAGRLILSAPGTRDAFVGDAVVVLAVDGTAARAYRCQSPSIAADEGRPCWDDEGDAPGVLTYR